MALDAVLCNAPLSMAPTALLAAYAATLEAATSNLEHEFLSHPVLSVLGAWVGEQDILAHLEYVAPAPLFHLHSRDSVASPPPPTRIVLVARAGSRQDDAALIDARAVIAAKLPPDAVLVLRLGDAFPADDPESLESVMGALAGAARANLAALSAKVTAEAERVRRASRSSFKSWFGAAAPKQMPTISSSIGLGTTATASSGTSGYAESDASSSTGGAPVAVMAARGESPGGRRARRRTSSMNGVIATPLFPADSVESLSRHVADLLLLSGDYEGAGEAYRTLAGEVSGCSGAASVHEASAMEHASLALALADGSKREVGSGLERSIKLYARAGRRELAVRSALRAAEYCVDAGFPDSAAGVLDRALSVTFPNIASSRAASGGSFAESAAAILYARTAFMFVRMGRRRKASLYAYISASRLSHESFHAAAAVIARNIDESALERPDIYDEVEMLYGRAAIALGEPQRGEAHFSGVMARTTESTDVEVQSRAILGFFDAIGKRPPVGSGASTSSSRRWDAGAAFPLVDLPSASVLTADVRSARKFMTAAADGGDGSSIEDEGQSDVFASDRGSFIRQTNSSDLDMDDERRLWEALENEVLQDVAYFDVLGTAKVSGRAPPKRERPVEDVIADLRREKEAGVGVDPGGSLESKINRMRESAASESGKRRKGSLLDTGAVVGEVLTLQLKLQNPLLFPVFVEEACPVVTLNGKVIDSFSADRSSSDGQPGVSMEPAGEIVILPTSSKNIELNVVVNEPGALCFIGARWMFYVGRSASAQDGNRMAAGFCLLNRRGPRLNTTRKQRASEMPMYGDDTTLRLEVIPPAPRLEMRFCSDDDSDNDLTSGLDDGSVVKLRAGQKFRTSMTITNSGQLAVDRIVFRIGTPHSLFVDVSSSDEFESVVQEEDAAKSSAMSSTIAGSLRCRLEPGESFDKPVWLFGSGSGETDVRLAVGYGDPVRVSRLSCKLVVGPSLNIFPRFIRRMAPPAQTVSAANDLSLDSSREKLAPLPSIPGVVAEGNDVYLLGIEVEHSGKTPGDVSFTVDSVSVSSLVNWSVQKLPSLVLPAGCDHLSGKSSRSSLRINETSTVFLVISRPNAGDSGTVLPKLSTSTVSLAREGSANQNSREMNGDSGERGSGLRASEHFLLTSGHAHRMGATSWQAVHTSLRWRSSHGHEGDMYLTPLDPSDWVNDDAEPEGDSILDEMPGTSPVEARVVHEREISHAFQCKIGDAGYVVPAVVPVDLFIRNTCDVLLDAVISAPVAGGIADGDRGRFWGGLVDATLRAIPPGIERRVSFSAILDSPGKYDLAKLVTKVRRHRSLAAPSEPVAVSRTFSRDVHTCELVPSYVVVDDVSHVSGSRRHATTPIPDLDTISYRQEPVLPKKSEVGDARSAGGGGGLDKSSDGSLPSGGKPAARIPGKAAVPQKGPAILSQAQDMDSAWDDGDSDDVDLL